MSRSLIFSILILIIKLVYRIDCFSCSTYTTKMGASYDLTELTRSADQGAYSVIDGDIPCTKNIESNYTYYFNICGTVQGNVPRMCKKLTGISGASALQVNERGTTTDTDDFCYIVGSYVESSTTIDLLDSEDPTKGIQLTYEGDQCKSGPTRKFKIQLECTDRLNPVPTHALELSPCEYTITMPSVYGCPVQCPISNRKLCGGNGHCAYDYDANSARCFCNKGYEGSDCNTASSSTVPLNYSPALLGLIITLFIIIAVLVGGIVFMIRQLAAYKDDISNYQALKGGDEEGSQAVV